MNVGPVDSEIPFELDPINDNVALEFVEELSLKFEVNPLFQVIVDNALAAGEFIRDSVIVSIADNDGKTIELFRTSNEKFHKLERVLGIALKGQETRPG